MNRRVFAIVLGGALVVTGAVAGAVATLNMPTAIAQPAPEGMMPPPGGMPMFDEIEFTEAQQAQFDQIHQNIISQVEGILTADQQQQLQSNLDNGYGFGRTMMAMNLTEEQQASIRSIFQSAHQEASAILTDEQRQALWDRVPLPMFGARGNCDGQPGSGGPHGPGRW